MDDEKGYLLLQRLSDLVEFPHESMEIEIKAWIDLSEKPNRANLAQAVLALANFGGGYVIIGFKEYGGQWTPAPNRPGSLERYTQDAVNGIVQRYAEPAFHCEVHHVRRHADGHEYPVVVVPGGHTVPIRAARSGPNDQHVQQLTYYTRGAGPSSRPVNSAREWDELLGRCIRNRREELLEHFREMLYGYQFQSEKGPLAAETAQDVAFEEWINTSSERWRTLVAERLANEKPSRFSHGTWWVAYQILGNSKTPTLGEFLGLLERSKGNETGWPAWWVPSRDGIAPYPYGGQIECCLFGSGVAHMYEDGAHSDFWRASPEGLMYLRRGYQEDGEEGQNRNIHPGSIFDLTLPVWRIGECLLHAGRLASLLGDDSASIRIRVQWSGLEGRRLVPWASRDRDLIGNRYSRQETVISEATVKCSSISRSLPEIVESITAPLYEVFNFFSPPAAMFHEELAKMRKRAHPSA